MGTILIVLTAVFAVYLTVIMTHRINSVVLKDTYIEVFRCELIICTVLLLFALDVRFGFLTKAHFALLRAAGWAARILLIGFAAVIVFFCVKIAAGSMARTKESAEHAIVLGLALENGKPTDDLLSRVDTARRYLEEHPDTTLILTGGNPDAGGRTEAAVMRELLLERGVPETKMILEDRAETTKENFQNTAWIIDPRESVVLITSDYHMDRAMQTARRVGFTHVMGLGAPSSFANFGVNVLWEVIMELNELTLKNNGPRGRDRRME